MEQEKQKFQDINRPLERLTQKEQDLYLKLNMKLLGEEVTIDISGSLDRKIVAVRKYETQEGKSFTVDGIKATALYRGNRANVSNGGNVQYAEAFEINHLILKPNQL